MGGCRHSEELVSRVEKAFAGNSGFLTQHHLLPRLTITNTQFASPLLDSLRALDYRAHLSRQSISC